MDYKVEYRIGDKVVYPNHGVGVIEQISFGFLEGRTEKYYMLRICSSGLKVMVPQTNACTVGLRPVIRNGETLRVLSYLEKGKCNAHHDWKHRFKENSERMRTGALIEVAAVLKSLVSLSRTKPLSFRGIHGGRTGEVARQGPPADAHEPRQGGSVNPKFDEPRFSNHTFKTPKPRPRCDRGFRFFAARLRWSRQEIFRPSNQG
jgi:CarD family transcriptional regulator